MSKLILHKLVFTKEMLERVPDCQRAVLVYAGHISNELNWFNKINLILQQTVKEIAKKLPVALTSQQQAILDGNATQTFIHVRLFAGKLHEAIQFLERWCFEMPWFREASREMLPEGKESLVRIQTHIEQIKNGTKFNLLRLVRNKFGFHYDDKAVKNSMAVSEAVEDFITYLADNVGNTLYLGSEYTVTEYLIESANQGDAKQTIENLMDETIDLARDINKVLGHTLSYIYLKYFGQDLKSVGHQEDVELDTEATESLKLPFFTTALSKVDDDNEVN